VKHIVFFSFNETTITSSEILLSLHSNPLSDSSCCSNGTLGASFLKFERNYQKTTQKMSKTAKFTENEFLTEFSFFPPSFFIQ